MRPATAGKSDCPAGIVLKEAKTAPTLMTSAYFACMSHRLMAWLAMNLRSTADDGRGECDLRVANRDGWRLEHLQPDCAGRKCSILLFDRMIHKL